MSWNSKEEIETTCSTVQQWRLFCISSLVICLIVLFVPCILYSCTVSVQQMHKIY